MCNIKGELMVGVFFFLNMMTSPCSYNTLSALLFFFPQRMCLAVFPGGT